MHRFGGVGLGSVVGAAVAIDLPVTLDRALLLGLFACAALLAGRAPRWAELALGLSLGLLVHAALPPGPRARGPVTLVGVVGSAAVGRTADVVAERYATPDAAWTDAGGRVRVRFPTSPAPPPGTRVVVAGLAGPVPPDGLPGAPDPVRAAARARITTEVRAWAAATVGGDPPPPAREVPGLLRAIALGDRAQVDPELLQLMRDTGTSHLLAISGSNVALIAGLGVLAARALQGLVALIRPSGLPGPLGPAAAIAASVAFTIAVGLPTSAQRACVGAALAAWASGSGRRLDPPSVLGACALAVILPDPSSVGQASFHLSFGAVAGLLTWGRAMDDAVTARAPSWALWPARLAIATLAATVGTLPASAWWFQAFAPLGPVANLFAVPWTSFVLTPCAFAALIGPDAIAGPAMALGTWATEVQRAALTPLAVAPWTPAVGPLGALALCGVYGMARRPLLAFAWVALCLAPRPRLDDRPVWTQLDVGQGSAALLERADGEVWLFDGGPAWAGTAAWIRRRHIRRLDRVIVSHGDADHIGGLPEVLRTLEVGALHHAGLDGLGPLLTLADELGVPLVDDPAERLWPPPVAPSSGPGRNDDSVVTHVSEGGHRVLTSGDLEAAGEAALAPALDPVDVLIAGHHGSRTSTTAAWLDALRPALVLISCGRANRYGHPHPDVLARAHAAGAAILRTDLAGTLSLRLGPGPLELRTYQPGRGWSAWAPAPLGAPRAGGDRPP